MRITADTNVLVRAVVADDPAQSQAAIASLRNAEQIAVALPALCEFVWVLRRVYSFPVAEISAAIWALMEAGNVSLDAVGEPVNVAVRLWPARGRANGIRIPAVRPAAIVVPLAFEIRRRPETLFRYDGRLARAV